MNLIKKNKYMFKLCLNYLGSFMILSLIFSCASDISKIDSEKELIEKALDIHNRVLTLDTHADTPLRMIQPGFDLSERHDPNETGSKLDYPRMVEGGLDAVFFAAFVAQDIRNDDGHNRAKNLCLQMIDSVITSTNRNSDMVGLALNPLLQRSLNSLSL